MKKFLIILLMVLLVSASSMAVTPSRFFEVQIRDNLMVSGNIGVDGSITGGGAQTVGGVLTAAEGFIQTPIARTTGGGVGSPNAIIAAGTGMVLPSSDGANSILVLPTPITGHVIVILPDTADNGFEIRPVSGDWVNGVQCTFNQELAVPAGSTMTAYAVSTNMWVINQLDNDGTTDAGGTPD